jgi:hypothetical protein
MHIDHLPVPLCSACLPMEGDYLSAVFSSSLGSLSVHEPVHHGPQPGEKVVDISDQPLKRLPLFLLFYTLPSSAVRCNRLYLLGNGRGHRQDQQALSAYRVGQAIKEQRYTGGDGESLHVSVQYPHDAKVDPMHLCTAPIHYALCTMHLCLCIYALMHLCIYAPLHLYLYAPMYLRTIT